MTGGSFSPRDAGILKQLSPLLPSPRLFTDGTNSSFPHASPEAPTSRNAPPPPHLASKSWHRGESRARSRGRCCCRHRSQGGSGRLGPFFGPWATAGQALAPGRQSAPHLSRRDRAPAPCGAPRRSPAPGARFAPGARPGDAAKRTARAERRGGRGGWGEGRVPCASDPARRVSAGQGAGVARRAAPDGGSGPSTPAGPTWRRAAARASLREQPPCALCVAASAPASARKLSRRKPLRPLLRGRRTVPGTPEAARPFPPQPRPTENMAPSNVVPRSPQGIPKCPVPRTLRLPVSAKL